MPISIESKQGIETNFTKAILIAIENILL